MKAISITVYWNPSTSSHNRMSGRNWRWVKRCKDQAKEQAWLGWRLAGHPTFDRKVRVSVHVRGPRAMDEANIWDGLKPVMDALFKEGACGVTPDDGPEWLTLGRVTQERVAAADACVTFHVEPVAEEASA